MRQTNSKGDSLYSLCIVCEGEATEPGFYKNYYEYIKKEYSPRYIIKVIPEPSTHEKNNKRTKRVTGNRNTNNSTIDTVERTHINEPMPLNWVLEGIDQLDTHNEVWVVFDKDGHPAVKEAFEKILSEREREKNIHLAFSSRCFEMFLLEHFEYNSTCFEKCECKIKINGKTVSLDCCSDSPKDGACNGDVCINGYARSKKYWDNSKNTDTFCYIDNIWRGIVNAHNLSWESLANDHTTPIYERNPFLNTYLLSLRMIEIYPFRNIDTIVIPKGNKYSWKISRNGNVLRLTNNSPLKWQIDLNEMLKAYRVIPYGTKCSLREMTSVAINFEPNRIEISPGKTYPIDLSPYQANVDFILLSINNRIYFVGFENSFENLEELSFVRLA